MGLKSKTAKNEQNRPYDTVCDIFLFRPQKNIWRPNSGKCHILKISCKNIKKFGRRRKESKIRF
jgi:hypothetical protein